MSDKKTKIFSRWGNNVGEAERKRLAEAMGIKADSHIHGLSPQEIERTAEATGPIPRFPLSKFDILAQNLPEGASLSPKSKRAQLTSSNPLSGLGNGVFTTQQPFLAELSRDKQNFPTHRRIQNSYWRLFMRTDELTGAVLSMLSTLPWSDCQLTGEGVDGKIKETYEYAWRECDLDSLLPYFVSEFLGLGELILQLHWDDAKGVWTHLAIHNPDNINVIYSPFLKMDPIIEFVPDEKLKQIATNDHPAMARVREMMPAELLQALRAGQNIPLSPSHVSFIPNKLCPYDLRGTSILTRLWRAYQSESHLWEAFITTARRSAFPVKVIKSGDPTTGFIPPPSEEQRILTMMAQAEQDPQATIATNFMYNFELWGDPGRLMSINTHYDLFEKIKLTALGVSKAFISGETSYSSSAAGLTIFLQRLKHYREFFVKKWLIPRFFLPIAVANGWKKKNSETETKGLLRVKKSSLNEMDEYILPTIEWEKSLDPNIDKERIDAMTALEQSLGIKISDQKKFASIGLDPEEEQKQIVSEIKFKRDLAGQDPLLAQAIGLQSPQAPESAGGGPGMMSPGIPPEMFGAGSGGVDESTSPESGGGEIPPVMPEGAGLAVEGDKEKTPAKSVSQTSSPNALEPSSLKYWSKESVQGLKEFMDTMDSDEEPWIYAMRDKDVKAAIASKNSDLLWDAIENWLVDENYPSDAITEIRGIVHGQHRNGSIHDDALAAQLLDSIGDDTLLDLKFS